MTTICYNHNDNNNNNWVHFNSHENQCFEDEEQEEALSLCDLPITSNSNSQELETISKNVENDQQDFEFGPCLGNTAIRSQDNMCNADEVFFQGQLLPLRHSVSYEKVELPRKINRRSMSDPRTIRSNGYKPRVSRNLFHSHPSPSPQIRSQSFRALNPKSSSSSSSSSLWSFLQVGLVKPQEIGLSDLKNRSKRFGSHNSNSSSNSSSGTTDQNQNQNQNQNRHQNPKSNPSKNTKKKQRLFFGRCNCSADSIERTIKEQVPKKKKTTKEENMLLPPTTTTTLQDQGKQTVSPHRTFEWLKQLSIATAAQSET